MNYIIAYGNVLRSDDGIGSHIIDHISREKSERESSYREKINNDICLLDFANNAWGILSLLNGKSEKILIIDCAYMGETAGSFKFFSLDDIDNQQNTLFDDAHGNNLVQLIKTAYLLEHQTTDISFMGIEPVSLEVGQELSPIIESKIDQYAHAAINFMG